MKKKKAKIILISIFVVFVVTAALMPFIFMQNKYLKYNISEKSISRIEYAEYTLAPFTSAIKEEGVI